MFVRSKFSSIDNSNRCLSCVFIEIGNKLLRLSRVRTPGVVVLEMPRDCNKHIPAGVSLNGERLIVVRIVIVDYLHSLVGGSLIAIRPEGTKSNR